ncbi:MAG: hypothetical protein JWQ21_3020 [Herminiimonas sp.]|nr:hypothetical protein [Herminiimonas sp.]
MGKLISCFRILRDLIILAYGLVWFRLTGKTPSVAYQSMVRLFCQTGGISNDVMSRLVSFGSSEYKFGSVSGVLGKCNPDKIQNITSQLRRDGYVLMENVIPQDVCDRLLKYALEQHCRPRRMTNGPALTSSKSVAYPRGAPETVRYDFSRQDIISHPDVQDLLADESFLAVAQDYLHATPVADVIAMWWHTSFGKVPDEDAAQYFHFDMDRIKWLKFFIMLTDVELENGPHVFIPATQRTGGIPESLRKRGYVRLYDDDVAKEISSEHWVEFIAKRGSLIIEDSRGLHKGRHVKNGDRLMLQLQFSNSLFGGYYEPAALPDVLTPKLRDAINRYTKTYKSFMRS